MHRGRPLKDLAMEVLQIAEGGLTAAPATTAGATTKRISSIRCLKSSRPAKPRRPSCFQCYHGDWKGDIDRVFAEFSY